VKDRLQDPVVDNLVLDFEKGNLIQYIYFLKVLLEFLFFLEKMQKKAAKCNYLFSIVNIHILLKSIA